MGISWRRFPCRHGALALERHDRVSPRARERLAFAPDALEGLPDIGIAARHVPERRIEDRFHGVDVKESCAAAEGARMEISFSPAQARGARAPAPPRAAACRRCARSSRFTKRYGPRA